MENRETEREIQREFEATNNGHALGGLTPRLDVLPAPGAYAHENASGK